MKHIGIKKKLDGKGRLTIPSDYLDTCKLNGSSDVEVKLIEINGKRGVFVYPANLNETKITSTISKP